MAPECPGIGWPIGPDATSALRQGRRGALAVRRRQACRRAPRPPISPALPAPSSRVQGRLPTLQHHLEWVNPTGARCNRGNGDHASPEPLRRTVRSVVTNDDGRSAFIGIGTTHRVEVECRGRGRRDGSRLVASVQSVTGPYAPTPWPRLVRPTLAKRLHRQVRARSPQ